MVASFAFSGIIGGRSRKLVAEKLRRREFDEDVTNDGMHVQHVLYQFDRKSFWIRPLSRLWKVSENTESRKTFVVELDKNPVYVVKDHQVYGYDVMPGAAHVSVFVQQCLETYKWKEMSVRNVEFREPVIVEKSTVLTYHHKIKGDNVSVEVKCGDSIHAVGTGKEFEGELQVFEKDFGEMEVTDAEEQMKDVGVDRGPAFRWIRKAAVKGNMAKVLFDAPSCWKQMRVALPGEVLDSIFSTGLVMTEGKMEVFYAPFSFEKLVIKRSLLQDEPFFVFTELTSQTSKRQVLDSMIIQGDQMIFKLTSFTAVSAPKESFLRSLESNDTKLLYEMKWKHIQGKKVKKEKKAVACLNLEPKDLQRLEYEPEIAGEAKVILSGSGMYMNINGQEKLKMAMKVLKELLNSRRKDVTVYTLTRKAHRLHSGEEINPWARTLWSMARTVNREAGSCMKHVLVDVENVGQINDELNFESEHSGEYLWRGKKRYGAALERVKEYPTPDTRYELGFTDRGSIANLRFLEAGEVERKAEEVFVRVMASGLNFRDVLNVLGMYPGDPGKMGRHSWIGS